MNKEQMKARTKSFGLRILRLSEALPRSRAADMIARQILRSGTSVGANYRSALRGRSNAEFLSKLGIVEEEADETAYWPELLADSGIMKTVRIANLLDECNQITAIIVATIKSAKQNSQ